MGIKLHSLWLAFGWLWVAMVFYLSLMPNPPKPVHFIYADKIEHALAYCLLMLWFCQVCKHRNSRIMLATFLVGMGIFIEYLQRASGYRQFDALDMLANFTGVMLGWLLVQSGLGQMLVFIENKLGSTK